MLQNYENLTEKYGLRQFISVREFQQRTTIPQPKKGLVGFLVRLFKGKPATSNEPKDYDFDTLTQLEMGTVVPLRRNEWGDHRVMVVDQRVKTLELVGVKAQTRIRYEEVWLDLFIGYQIYDAQLVAQSVKDPLRLFSNHIQQIAKDYVIQRELATLNERELANTILDIDKFTPTGIGVITVQTSINFPEDIIETDRRIEKARRKAETVKAELETEADVEVQRSIIEAEAEDRQLNRDERTALRELRLRSEPNSLEAAIERDSTINELRLEQGVNAELDQVAQLAERDKDYQAIQNMLRQAGLPPIAAIMASDDPAFRRMREWITEMLRADQQHRTDALHKITETFHAILSANPPDEAVAYLTEQVGGLLQDLENQPTSVEAFLKGMTQMEESVSFTHFYPSIIAKLSSEIPLHVYVHSTSKIEQVKIDFEERRTFELARSYTENNTLPFLRGTTFTIIPFIENARVQPSLAEITWIDDLEHVKFIIKVDKNLKSGGALTGEVRIYVGPLVVASLPIGILLDEKQGASYIEMSRETRYPYNSIFVSYSHDDQAVVRAIDRLYEKYPEIEHMIDYKFLKSGDYWWEEIKKQIEAAEAVELFWSPSAAKSKAVEDEWRYALKLPRPILPVIFGRPRPEIPGELQHIHFEDFDSFLASF